MELNLNSVNKRCCESGKADFGSAEVDINTDNPLKIVAQKATWVDAFKVTEETTVDATTVNI